MTLNNTSSVDGSVTVQYRYLQTDNWKTLTTKAVSAGNSTNVEYTLVDPYVEFQYAPFGTTNWSNSGLVYKVTNCETAGNPLTALNTFICSEDQPFAQVKISNPTTTNQTVTYSYSFNGTSWTNEKTVLIPANTTHLSDLINVTKGTQIRWRYKPTNLTDNDYKTLTDTAPVNCDISTNQQIIHTLGTCENNKALSTIKVTNLSSSQKSYLLEYKIDNGTFARYETLIISAGSNTTKTLQISEGQNIQWRIIDATSDTATISVDGNWETSTALTLSCTTPPTTIIENKFIFEPLISTNRICSEDGGAMFGITVDNTRSNVDADVIQRVWVDKFTVFEKQETIPAGESIQFSSFEISEDKYFTVEFEVTNVKNDKTQSMVKNKTSDCLDSGIGPTDNQNPFEDLFEPDTNVIDGAGDNEEMGDNGDDIFFLPGDDFVEWVYNEDALDISPPPLCPGDASCNNAQPPFAETGSNVGRIILMLGSLLMVAGGFILRRGYRF